MIKKILAGVAIAAGLVLALPAQKAEAVTLLSPGSAFTVKHVSEAMTTEVRWGGRRGFHRGHFRGHRGWRPRRAWHPRRYWAPRAFYAAPRRCRIVMTYYGPQRICRRWY
jgi:hypothetical protein